jgi:hypothetical protein
MNSRDHEELTEIHEKMLELVNDVERIMRREGGIEYERAKGYWLANIKMGLTNNHGYLSMPMFNMETAISALEPCEDEDQEEDSQ